MLKDKNQKTWNWFKEEKYKKFSAQSDGSENISSNVTFSQGTKVTLNDNNTEYLHEYPVSHTKETAKVVCPLILDTTLKALKYQSPNFSEDLTAFSPNLDIQIEKQTSWPLWEINFNWLVSGQYPLVHAIETELLHFFLSSLH